MLPVVGFLLWSLFMHGYCILQLENHPFKKNGNAHYQLQRNVNILPEPNKSFILTSYFRLCLCRKREKRLGAAFYFIGNFY
jgi:hypothetical protein